MGFLRQRKKGRPKEEAKYKVSGYLEPVLGGLFQRVYMHPRIDTKNQLVRWALMDSLPRIASELGIEITDDELEALGIIVIGSTDP